MVTDIDRILSQDELKNLTQTITVKQKSLPGSTPDRRIKVRYIATKDTSILKIMGAAVYAMQQKGLHEKANELRKLILSGAYEEQADALELIGKYVRLKITNEEGTELGSLR